MVDMVLSIQIGSTGGHKQVFNIFTHIAQLRLKDLFTREELTVLAKDPRVTLPKIPTNLKLLSPTLATK